MGDKKKAIKEQTKMFENLYFTFKCRGFQTR